MSNQIIEVDLKEIFTELKDGQNKILEKIEALDSKVESIDKRLVKVETTLENKFPEIDKKLDSLAGQQTAQIWTLIGILVTAVGGFLVAVARQVLTFNS